MKRYIIYGLSLIMFSAAPAFAQDEADEDAPSAKREQPAKPRKQYPTRVVKGRVLNATTNNPVSGAMIRTAEVDGYSTLSHSDGTYELKVPLFATSLQVSAPDLNMAKIGLVKGEEQRDVMLYPETFSKEYADGTNVLGTESATDFRYSNAVTIEDEVQKRLGADVRVINRNGTPGIGGVMFMNGINSLNINAQPLIVVDGVIFDQQFGRTMLHEGFYNDILSNISPSDIEKVTVQVRGIALEL